MKRYLWFLIGVMLTWVACGSPPSGGEAPPSADSAQIDPAVPPTPFQQQDSDSGAAEMPDMTLLEGSLSESTEEGFSIVDPYGSAGPEVQPTGAFYMTINNGTSIDERLLAVSSDRCGIVELHEMGMQDDVMIMRPIDGGEVPIPAKSAVEFKPGGLHLMCIDKEGAFEAGESVMLNLTFAMNGTVRIEADIREIEP